MVSHMSTLNSTHRKRYTYSCRCIEILQHGRIRHSRPPLRSSPALVPGGRAPLELKPTAQGGVDVETARGAPARAMSGPVAMMKKRMKQQQTAVRGGSRRKIVRIGRCGCNGETRTRQLLVCAEGSASSGEEGETGSVKVSVSEEYCPPASAPAVGQVGNGLVDDGSKPERPAERFMILDLGEADCSKCGYHYEPKKGDPEYPIASGTLFSNLPGDWICPLCGAEKMSFRPTSKEIAGFAENQSYGFGTNSMTAGEKTLLIYGSLGTEVGAHALHEL